MEQPPRAAEAAQPAKVSEAKRIQDRQIAENAGVSQLLADSSDQMALGTRAIGLKTSEGAGAKQPPVGKWSKSLANRNAERSIAELVAMPTATWRGTISKAKATYRIDVPVAYAASDMANGHWNVISASGDACARDKSLCQTFYSMGTSLKPNFSVRAQYRPNVEDADCNADRSDCIRVTHERKSGYMNEIEVERFITTTTDYSVRCGGWASSFSWVSDEDVEPARALLRRVCASIVVQRVKGNGI